MVRLILLIVTFVAGYITALFIKPHDLFDTQLTTIKTSKKAPKPKFEFYSLLTKHSSTAHKRYYIQVAAFKNKADAEKLKATLILKGYEIFITKTHAPKNTWYRLFAGPYFSKDTLDKRQLTLLKSEHIKGIVKNSKN